MTFWILWLRHRCTCWSAPKTSSMAVRRALAPSMMNRYLRSVGRPRSRSPVNSCFTAAAFSVAPEPIPKHVLVAFDVHAHGAENVVLGETLAVDINHQNLNLIPAPLLQLLELLDACLHGLPTNRTPGDPHSFRHFWQYLVVFTGRDSTH